MEDRVGKNGQGFWGSWAVRLLIGWILIVGGGNLWRAVTYRPDPHEVKAVLRLFTKAKFQGYDTLTPWEFDELQIKRDFARRWCPRTLAAMDQDLDELQFYLATRADEMKLGYE